MNTQNNKKICIMSLTYNRPSYIERSFDSLYARAAHKFDHYVFDDNSNSETVQILRKLQKKYGFTLVHNKTQLGIFRSFHKNIKNIDPIYDVYIKFDSDIEVLTDNFLPQLIEVLDMPTKLSGVTPRVEGMFNSQRFDRFPLQRVDFYNGHVVRDIPIGYGCCLCFTKEVFESFPTLTDNEIAASTEQFAIDSKLYEHSLQFGKFMIVEDLSVYHIDNTYGQRRRDMEYFISRNRWHTADNDEVWFLRASKDIYPRHLRRSAFDKLRNSSGQSYDMFLRACLDALEYGIDTDEHNFDVSTISEKGKISIFKISAPDNFVGSRNLARGTSIYVRTIPAWARTDMGVVVEKVQMTIKDAQQVLSDDT